MPSEIYARINNCKEKHPFIFGVFIFFLGTMFGAIITHYVENTLWDIEPPYIGNINPGPNSYLNEIAEAIIVNFVENGGSGIDEDNSRINLTGAKSGVIKGTINFTKDNMSFKPETELKPDEYTIKIQIADRENPPQKDISKFYILRNSSLSTRGEKPIEDIENLWLNKTVFKDIRWKENYDDFEFTIINNNDISITDVNLQIVLPGVIKKSSAFYERGITDYKFKLGQTSVMFAQVEGEVRELNSCSLRIEIKEMAPDSVFSASIITDSNISNYTVSWCPSEDAITYFSDDGIYGIYEGSYRYNEYGIGYSKSIRGNFTGEKKYRNKILPKTSLSDEQLKEQALELSHNLLEFARDRGGNESQIHSKDWNSYGNETKNLYFDRYGLQVAILREEFLKRGVVDEELRSLYDFPAGPYPYQKMALRLAAMSSKLPPDSNNEQLKKQALELSQNLLEFARDRENNEPEIRSKDWDGYSKETKNLYFTRYGLKVAILQEELLKHNITDSEFKRLYDFPAGPHPYQEISLRLVAMVSRLPNGLSNEQLKKQALELSQNLSEFVNERKNNEPKFDDSMDWNNSTQKSISYSKETGNLYFVRYGLQVAILREEFLKRNIRDEEFERLYDFPMGGMGIQVTSNRLVPMANKLSINEPMFSALPSVFQSS